MIKSHTRDRLIGLGLLIGSALVYWRTYAFARQNMGMGPQVFPRLLALLLAIFCVILILFPKKDKTLKTQSAPDSEKAKSARIKTVVTFIALAGYAALMPVVGYVLSTILYLVFMTFYLGERNPLRMAIWGIGVAMAVFLIFDKLLNVPLPGMWFRCW